MSQLASITPGDATGYRDAVYAASLSEWGTPRRLNRADSWSMVSRIPGTDRLDASGCYPLMACGNWAGLVEDLHAADQEWVAFTAVPDPLGAPGADELRKTFRDHIRPFKTHHLVNLERWTAAPGAQHRARIRRSARHVEIEVAPARAELLEPWIELYTSLATRHAIHGLRRFSRQSFAALFTLPGLHAARTIAGDETVAMSLWVTAGRNAYYHLGASSEKGYALSAAYPMFDAAIRYLGKIGLEWLDLGGGAGISERPGDGLAQFKRGWATAERTAWLCGRVLDRAAYDELAPGPHGEFFPAYRTGTAL